MLSSTEPMKKFESAAQNLVDQKLPTQMVTLTEGAQLLEQYEMVLLLFKYNSFLPQLGYLMPAISASLIMSCLFHCVLGQQSIISPGKVFQILLIFATKKQIGQNRAKFRLFENLSPFWEPCVCSFV